MAGKLERPPEIVEAENEFTRLANFAGRIRETIRLLPDRYSLEAQQLERIYDCVIKDVFRVGAEWDDQIDAWKRVRPKWWEERKGSSGAPVGSSRSSQRTSARTTRAG